MFRNFPINIVIYIFIFNFNSIAQVILVDDFQNRSDYWYWRSDGNQTPPNVENGLLHLQLLNAVDSLYANTEIYDPTTPYSSGTQVRIRLKATDIHYGSRGWGFWDGHLDINSLVFDYDVAWVMQQASHKVSSDYNWFLFGVDGNLLTNRETIELSGVVDETKWHTYKIVWNTNSVDFFIDGSFIYTTNKNLPDEDMRVDIWIDNRIFNINNPLELWHNNVDNSEIHVDFVEVSGLEGPSITRDLQNNIILWQSPNTFPDGGENIVWQDYSFNKSKPGDVLIIITGNAENYNSKHITDKMSIMIDGVDLSNDNNNVLDGSLLQGRGKSVILPLDLTVGDHNIKLISSGTPFLRDVIVLSNENGKLLFSSDYNTKINSDGLWKKFEIDSEISQEIMLIISGTGYQNSKLTFELNGISFGNDESKSIVGNSLNGIPNTIVVQSNLLQGKNILKIYNSGVSELYSIAIYGESIITDVKVNKPNLDNVNLQSFPNPFNNSTMINYISNSYSHNTVTIYNSLGEKIKTLVDDYQPKGEHNIIWDANFETSGIYFCIFQSGNNIKVEKLLLLK